MDALEPAIRRGQAPALLWGIDDVWMHLNPQYGGGKPPPYCGVSMMYGIIEKGFSIIN